jgi:hypothetical protein
MKAAVVGVAMILSATAATAASVQVSATLRTPVKATTGFSDGDTIWNCDKDRCRTTTAVPYAYSWMACRDLTRKVGPVTAYGTLASTALARCNEDSTAR